jgi:hypothetical protein
MHLNPAGAWLFAGGIKYDSCNNSTDLGKKEKSQKNNKSKTRNAKYEINSKFKETAGARKL